MLDTLTRRLERLEGEAARPWAFIRVLPDGRASATYHGDRRGGPHAMTAAEAEALAERLRREGVPVLVIERRVVDAPPRPEALH
jgi:hypothetical protein